MKTYITASFKWLDNQKEIEYLCNIVQRWGLDSFCFIRDVEHYQKLFTDPQELMQRAKEEIEKCDALLIDYNGPASGRMIELGIAYAMSKYIIIITTRGTIIKETIQWVADIIIEYDTIEDIIPHLKTIAAKTYL